MAKDSGVEVATVGTVEWDRGSERVQATIDFDGRWSSEADGIADFLNMHYSQDRYGPEDGYPAWAAMADVAKDSGGTIVNQAELRQDEESAVY